MSKNIFMLISSSDRLINKCPAMKRSSWYGKIDVVSLAKDSFGYTIAILEIFEGCLILFYRFFRLIAHSKASVKFANQIYHVL